MQVKVTRKIDRAPVCSGVFSKPLGMTEHEARAGFIKHVIETYEGAQGLTPNDLDVQWF